MPSYHRPPAPNTGRHHRKPIRLPVGGAARYCPDCTTVFVVWADQWDCACCWRCHDCLAGRRAA